MTGYWNVLLTVHPNAFQYYNTISLDRCQKVENDAVVEGKKVEHIIMLHFPNESKQQVSCLCDDSSKMKFL